MGCSAELLGELGPSIERELKPNLRGLAGLVVRRYLPQRWVFSTGSEFASLCVDDQGNVSAYEGAVAGPDVLISTSHETLSRALEAALGRRPRSSVPQGEVRPTFYTPKGRTAFNYLRGRLGL